MTHQETLEKFIVDWPKRTRLRTPLHEIPQSTSFRALLAVRCDPGLTLEQITELVERHQMRVLIALRRLEDKGLVGRLERDTGVTWYPL